MPRVAVCAERRPHSGDSRQKRRLSGRGPPAEGAHLIMMGKGLTEVPAGNLAWFLITLGICQLILIAGAAYFTQRCLRRRWRIANVDKTGGVYLRMWQKTPHPEQ